MKKNIKIYVIFTYLMFFLFIGVIGIAMMLFKNEFLTTVLQKVSAWTPTFVLLLMFKKIYPQESRMQFIRKQFTQRITPKILIATIGIPVAIFVAALIFSVFFYQKSFTELMILSPLSLLSMLPLHFISGPLGEELGWRAFLLTETQKKHSTLISGIIVGLIWGFWHLPLWLISGYEATTLILYIVSFLVSIICCSIIITILYTKCRNLLVAIIIHLLNNFLLGLFTFNLVEALMIFTACYVVTTVILVLTTKKLSVQKNKRLG